MQQRRNLCDSQSCSFLNQPNFNIYYKNFLKRKLQKKLQKSYKKVTKII